jgi:hypothetical protein
MRLGFSSSSYFTTNRQITFVPGNPVSVAQATKNALSKKAGTTVKGGTPFKKNIGKEMLASRWKPLQ